MTRSQTFRAELRQDARLLREMADALDRRADALVHESSKDATRREAERLSAIRAALAEEPDPGFRGFSWHGPSHAPVRDFA